MNNIQYISKRVSCPASSITATVKLLEEDSTIPFIARYRKDQTGNLDEEAIEQISKANRDFGILFKRKEAILKSIAEQDALTPELKQKIDASFEIEELEDLYLPFKKKRTTRADIARKNGLEPLAKIIMAQNADQLERLALRYINDKVSSEADALQGARDIIAEWINENLFIRKLLRRHISRTAVLASNAVKTAADDPKAQKFEQYFEFSEAVHKMPSHRLLAMLRAEKEGFVKIRISADEPRSIEIISSSIIKGSKECAAQLSMAIADSYNRLLFPSLSNEVLQDAKQKADLNSIKVFAANLSQLLMAPPLGEKRILAIDPGFRSGCKIVCLDEKGDLLYNETIFPHPPQNEAAIAMKKIRSMVNAYKIDAISIGNGTASRETEHFIKKISFDKPVQVFVVSEAGASVYSASKVAREEFPNYDVTVRGAVSIGRRLSDPLAELVKIDPKAIGVGQYQHDVDQGKLQEELDTVVVRCVNSVGVNLNTASKHLLSYVSGIGEKLAENIVNYRSANGGFTDRSQLQKIPRLGEKAFQQCAAFVRIPGSENPLDNSAVHPESYKIVKKMAADVGVPVAELIRNTEKIRQIDPQKYIAGQVGEHTVKDIIKELEKPALDPRKSAKILEFDQSVKTISDVHAGMVLPGIVNNITNFGCFVDIGIKESGLVHISQLKEGFVSDVNSVVSLHQHVKVKVTDVDQERKRIQLSMIL